MITETWLRNNDEDTVWLNAQNLKDFGIKQSHQNRSDKKGGGIILLYRNTMMLESTENRSSDCFEACLWRLKMGSTVVNLLGVYHPPFGSTELNTRVNFLDQFTNLLADLIPNKENLILMGDFNVHVNKYDTDDDAQMFTDTLEAMGLMIRNNQPTHQAGNVLDLIITETLSKTYVSGVTNGSFLSDHCVVKCQLNVSKPGHLAKEISTRNLKDMDTNKFGLGVASDLKSQNTTLLNVDEKAEYLQQILLKQLDVWAPVTTKEVIERKKNPWFDSTMKTLKKDMRRRERIWQKYQQGHQWIAFSKARTKYQLKLKENKFDKMKSKVNDCFGNTKRLYKLVSNLTGTEMENPLPESESDEELAEKFADFFIGKIQKIRDNLDELEEFKPVERNNVPQMNEFRTYTSDQITKMINSMASKSCESDSIPTVLLKEILPHVIEIITDIVNTSLKEGVFVQKWKVAIVRPLLKKMGMDLICKSYRPASNLNFLSKVLEKAAMEQFVHHWEDNSLLPDYQSAYRANRSCETVLLKLVNDLLWTFEESSVSSLVAIDLSAAFDTVLHEILLDLLNKQFGMTQTVNKWISNYLRPRSMKVVINKTFSNPRNLPFSVPQGSLLGPFLYLAYASPIADVVPEDISIYGFADAH